MANVVGRGVIVIDADASGVPGEIRGQASAATKAGSKVGDGAGDALGDGLATGTEEGVDRANKRVPGKAASLGKAAAGALGTALVAGAAVAGAGVAAGLGLAFSKGFQRLNSIDQAEGKLKGLGYTGKEIGGVMDDALASVQGTAFGLGDAATQAATLMAAGVKPGEDLESTLTLVGDAATIAGSSFGDMGNIFSQVATAGKLTTEDMKQMQERGIPVLQYLADQYDVTAAEAQKMVTSGEVSFEEFQQAMEKNLGGAAQSSGETFMGALANVQAALGRFGAGALEGSFEGMKPVFAGLIDLIDGLTEAMTPLFDKMNGAILPAMEKFGGFLSGIGGALSGASGGFGEISGVLGALGPVLGGIVGAMGPLLERLPKIGGAFKGLTGPVGILIGFFAQMFAESSQLRQAFGDIFTTLGTVLGTVMSAVGPLLGVLGDAIGNIAKVLGDALGQAIQAILPLITGLVTALGPLLSAVVGALLPIITQLAEIFTGLLSSALNAVIPVISTLVQAILPPLVTLIQSLMPIVTNLGNVIGSVLKTAFDALLPVITGLLPLFGKIIQAIAPLVGTILTALLPLITQLAQIFAQVLTGALRAVLPVFMQLIKAVLPILIQVIRQLLPIIVQLVKMLGPTLMQVISSLLPILAQVAPLFLAIVRAVLPIATQIISALMPLVTMLLDLLMPTIEALLPIVRTVFGAISSIISAAMKIVQGIISVVMNAIRGNWAGVWQGIKNTLKAVWDYIKTVVRAAIGVVKAIIAAVMKVIRLIWSTAWNAVKDKVTGVWDAIKRVLKAGWDWIDQHVLVVFKAGLRALRDVFSNVGDRIAAIWRGLRDALKKVWDWISEHVLDKFKGGLRALRDVFSSVKTRIGEIWDGLKTKLSNVWNWIDEHVFAKMRGGVGLIKEAFRKAKDGIGRIWDKVKGIVAKPINFMIKTVYNNGLRKMINTVLGWLGQDKLKRVAPISGFDAGGYTGRGGKYTPAGLVHADEFVVRKEARQKFERNAPGALDHLNKYGSLPGYAQGGTVGRLIKGIKWWQDKGARVLEFKPWTGVSPVHMQGSMHYLGRAADLNFGPGGQNAIETGFFDGNLPDFRKLFPDLHVIWKRAGHFNHLHLDNSVGDGTGKPGEGGGAGGGFNPFGIISKIKGLTSKMTGEMFDGPIGKMLKGVGTKLINGPIEWIKAQAGNLAGKVSDAGKAIGSMIGKGKIVASVKNVARQIGPGLFGWSTGAQWDAIAHIIDRESGWNPNAANPSSSARGLFQKMTSIHGAIEPTVRGQAQWGINYIKDRYGSPVAAWEFWKRNHHYDAGGWLPSGGFGFNTSGKPEAVLTGPQSAALVEMSRALTRPRTGSDNTAPSGTVVNVQPGAIQVNTLATDPNLVASKVLDRFVRLAG